MTVTKTITDERKVVTMMRHSITFRAESGQTMAEYALVVGVITYLMVYMLALIRDVDNPFEYRGGLPGPADVDLGVLERCETRLRSLAATIRSG